MTFAQVKIGAHFRRQNTIWKKRSSRTATITNGAGKGLWFYWGQKETIDCLVAHVELPQ
jgi:hypothetical protein